MAITGGVHCTYQEGQGHVPTHKVRILGHIANEC